MNYLLHLITTLLLLFVTSASAHIYKCADEHSASFGYIPCAQEIGFVHSDHPPKLSALLKREYLTVPIFPDWKAHGWVKRKEIQLEHFSETVYQPNMDMMETLKPHLNIQHLNNIPNDLNSHRFAVSIADIIQTVCADSHLSQPTLINLDKRDDAFYGQYMCSLRRDTQQGEFGSYKIMRAEKGIYLVALKWPVAPFYIDAKQPILMSPANLQKLADSVHYLQHQVKLCRGKICL